MPSRFRTSLQAALPSLAVLALLLGDLPAAAQVNQGGKGGGLPGHGPSDQGGRPRGSTGGKPLPDDQLAYHVLDRLTYGHTEDDLAAVRALGVDAWIRWQLDPANIPESPALTTRLASLPPIYTATQDPSWGWSQVYADYLLRARYGARQLEEVMTEFWSNHFDTGLQLVGGGKTGWYNSLVIRRPGDVPEMAIAYFDYYAGRPVYAYWTGSSWVGLSIEGSRFAANGAYTSLAFDPTQNQPAVAYYDGRSNNLDLKLATFNGTAWTIDRPDTAGDVGQWASLAYDATGRAWIAYYDATNGDLKLASGRPGNWTIQVVDGAGDVGRHASLELTAAGLPRIAYYDATQTALKYAAFDGVAWTVETVDAGPNVGQWASLALHPTSELPAIAYYDAGNRTLRYVESRGPSWRAPVVVDSNGDVGKYASLAFRASGNPAISYYEDAPRYDLKFAEWDGAAWVTSGVDVDGARPAIAGEWTSLAFDASDNANILYHNGSQFTLRRAVWNGTTWSRTTVDNPGQGDFVYAVWEKEETDKLRAAALGRFRDLLEISATSPAMMVFLDNYQNTASNGNENYGRELLELHTVGVDGGYDQTDVETISRALTGWGVTPPSSRCDVRQGSFCYNHLAHDGTARTVMGIALPDDAAATPGNYMLQGHLMLDALARHPSTARFVCRKLIEKFVADQPPPRLWAECQATFLASDGDIARVLEALFFSPEFRDPQYFLNKVRTPFEYTLATVRHLEGDTDGYSLWTPISNQGMPLFRNTIPTGWAEVGTDWISSNSLLQRWKWADQVTHQSAGTTTDPYALVRQTGIDTADGVVEFFAQKLLRGQLGTLERSLLLDCACGGTSPCVFDINDTVNTPGRVRDTVDMMLGFPIYQKQ